MEKTISKYYLEKLATYFTVEEQVCGIHFSGKNLRIDAVLTPKSYDGWKNKTFSFGIEFKNHLEYERSFDTNNYTKWLAQCVDYSNTKWGKYGYIYIFVCPGISEQMPESTISSYNFSIHLLGQLGIGEIINDHYNGLTLTLNQNNKVWSEKMGVMIGKNHGLTRTFGSR